MEVISDLIVEITKCMGRCCWRQLRHMKGLEKNLENLNDELGELTVKAEEVRKEIEWMKLRKGMNPKPQVMQWQRKVDSIKQEALKLKENSKEDMKVCNGCLPNCLKRLELSKSAVRMAKEITELQQKRPVLNDTPFEWSLEDRKSLPTSSIAGKKHWKAREDIWECLSSDSEVKIIGVYGIGGVGKTSIMKHIYNELNEKSIFDYVIWVTVSKDSTLEQLQNNIAQLLDIELLTDLDDMRRSQAIYEALLRRKRFVLILDDMWTAFSLEKVGIPQPDRDNGCKVVFTTRSLEVCKGMESEKNIKVETLTEEEAWELFKEKVGHKFSPEVEVYAKLVCNECRGLPLAIIILGRSMREEGDVRLWRNTYSELRSSKKEIQINTEESVFVTLKYSYERLKDDKIKACFLYCALYPEDFSIPTKDLIEQWMGEELIDEVWSREEEKDNGQAILDKLKSACLLERGLSGIDGECVKMHDLIRDMAIRITRKQPRFMVKAGVGLTQQPKEIEWSEDIERISLMRNNIEMLSGTPNSPKLSTLLLQENRVLRAIEGSFFERMHSLRVLNLSHTKVELLPESLSNLENLRSLLLHYCSKLKKLPSVAKLRQLRVLDIYYTPVKELPQGMEALANLRHLNISWTHNLQHFPTGILQNLPNLEDMLMYGNQYKWSSSRRDTKGASIEEINELKHLANLRIHIADLQSFRSYVGSKNWRSLKSFHLIVGPTLQSDLLPLDCTIEIHGCDLKGEGSTFVIPKNVRVLGIYECNIAGLSGLPCLVEVELKECSIHRCDEMKYVLMENENPFPSLEMLDLEVLPNLEALHKGMVSQDTFRSLKHLYIGSCNSLKVLFSIELLQQLQNLEQLKVRNCDVMEEIIDGDKVVSGEVENSSMVILPSLKRLRLDGLKELELICKRVVICRSLRSIRIRECPKLKKLPFSVDKLQLEKIKGEKEWWDALEWNDEHAKALLQLLFIDIAKKC